MEETDKGREYNRFVADLKLAAWLRPLHMGCGALERVS